MFLPIAFSSSPRTFSTCDELFHRGHEFPGPVCFRLSRLIMKKRDSGLLTKFPHPLENCGTWVASSRHQTVCRAIAPRNRQDNHAGKRWFERIGKGVVKPHPATYKLTARVHRAFFINAAVPFADKMAWRSGLHFMSKDIASQPAIAASSTTAAGA